MKSFEEEINIPFSSTLTTKAMNKEEKNCHVLPFKSWVAYFSPYCRATLQGICEKCRKFRVVINSSTQTNPDEVVLNHVTPTDHHKAPIDFGIAKRKLLTNIYIIGASAFRTKLYISSLPTSLLAFTSREYPKMFQALSVS